MAHEDCIATGGITWTSTFSSHGDDGEIEIKEVSNQLEGTHLDTKAKLKNIDCDGKKISFSREDPEKGEEVFYEDGKMTKLVDKVRIKGKVRRVPLLVDGADSRIEQSKGTELDPDEGGDWEAEKPIA
jgi:hypothetical protein